MMTIALLAFLFGLIGACYSSIRRPRLQTFLLVPTVITGIIFFHYDIPTESIIDGTAPLKDLVYVGFLSGLVTVAVLLFFHIKDLRFEINELQYMTHISITLYLMFAFPESLSFWLTLLLIGIIGVTTFPLLINRAFSEGIKSIYFLSYAGMVAYFFYVVVVNNIFSELGVMLSHAYSWGFALLLGWSVYNYFMCLAFLLMLMPNKQWNETIERVFSASALYFSTRQFHPLLLIVVSAVSIVAINFTHQVTGSVLAAVALVSGVVGYASQVTLRSTNYFKHAPKT